MSIILAAFSAFDEPHRNTAAGEPIRQLAAQLSFLLYLYARQLAFSTLAFRLGIFIS